MISIKTILCPVDFFPASDKAVEYAAGLAAKYGAKMHLLHVVTPGVPVASEYPLNTPELMKLREDALLSEMKALARKLELRGVAVEIEMRTGDVYDTIERRISLGKPDLVVMTTHGRRTIWWFLGSVTESIMRRSSVPVLSISPNERIHKPPFRRILVATDFSDGTADALDYAFSIAQEDDSRITMLHVIPDLAMALSIEDRTSLIQGVRKQLEDLVPPDAKDCRKVSTIVEEGLPYRIILRTLDTAKPDLLVMNIHGNSMFERALHGRTAERVIRAASCPVMLIPPMKVKAARTACPDVHTPQRAIADTAGWSFVA